MYAQGRRIRATVPKLPEATGTSGRINNGQLTDFQLLTIGESTVAGVGVRTHQEGFTGTLARELATNMARSVTWRVYAKSGITAERVPDELLSKVTEPSADLIVVGLGANDAFAGYPPSRWRRDMRTIIEQLRGQFPTTPIAFANMPPIKEFPAFTPLIKWTIGNLIEWYAAELADLAGEYAKVYFNDEIITFDKWVRYGAGQRPTADFFSDGVHPSKLTYQTWAVDFNQFLQAQKVLDRHR